ncbi:MAG: phosphoribosyl transferase [Coxiella sp. RIFCSPHIGHO2_12_FULL_44_14]|nr:MAG: phosphoribosyl transferase [Coxiella sp. RIFCSPHIGHO2_12_FULL_44_14]
MTLFRNRTDAGQQLAHKLSRYAQKPNVIVLALPRGGVPVGFEIAQALQVPLDIFLVRKLGVPGQEELAMGAIASGDIEVLNQDIVQSLHIPRHIIEAIKAKEAAVIQQRNTLYRKNYPPLPIKNKTVILVDDGVATGATLRAAIAAIRQLGCSRLIVAIPLAPESTYHELKQELDEIECLATPEPFFAIGNWYHHFPQTSDEEVCALIAANRSQPFINPV